jgi:hypothetical protein
MTKPDPKLFDRNVVLQDLTPLDPLTSVGGGAHTVAPTTCRSRLAVGARSHVDPDPVRQSYPFTTLRQSRGGCCEIVYSRREHDRLLHQAAQAIGLCLARYKRARSSMAAVSTWTLDAFCSNLRPN